MKLIFILLISLPIYATSPDHAFNQSLVHFNAYENILAYIGFRDAYYMYLQEGDSLGMAHSMCFKGQVLARMGKYALSVDRLEKARAIYEKLGDRSINYAKALHKLHYYNEADQIFREHLDDYRAWNWIGISHRKRGDYDSAMYCHQKAIEMSGGDNWTYNSIGKMLYLNHDYKGAIKHHRIALSKTNKDEHAMRFNTHTHIANCYYAMGKYFKAKNELLAVAKLNNGNYSNISHNQELLKKVESKLEKYYLFALFLFAIIVILILVYYKIKIWQNSREIAKTQIKLNIIEKYMQLCARSLKIAKIDIKLMHRDEAIKDIEQAEEIIKGPFNQVF